MVSTGLKAHNFQDVGFKYQPAPPYAVDPAVDKFVSKNMLRANGFYDEHVHAALEIALRATGHMCDAANPVVDVARRRRCRLNTSA